MPLDVVIAEFEKCKGTQFDPALDDVFLDILKNHYDEIKEIQEKYKKVKNKDDLFISHPCFTFYTFIDNPTFFLSLSILITFTFTISPTETKSDGFL